MPYLSRSWEKEGREEKEEREEVEPRDQHQPVEFGQPRFPLPCCLHLAPPRGRQAPLPLPQGQSARKPWRRRAETKRQEGPLGKDPGGKQRARWGSLCWEEAVGRTGRSGWEKKRWYGTWSWREEGGWVGPSWGILALGLSSFCLHAQPPSLGTSSAGPRCPWLPDSYPGTCPIQISAPVMLSPCISPSRVLIYTHVILYLDFMPVFLRVCHCESVRMLIDESAYIWYSVPL